LVPSDYDTYIDLNIHPHFRGKLTSTDGTVLEATDYTAETNNYLHSIFSQSSITLKGFKITSAAGLYPYGAYFETLFTYGSDDATSHLKNAFWYLDIGNTNACVYTAA
jgi:hypothetical protein